MVTQARAEEPKRAPHAVLKSADGKAAYDLDKMVADGPVLVRLTCACSGCDRELPYFQKLEAAYRPNGLRVIAVFQEKPETAKQYVADKSIKFAWVSDPNGETWKIFDAHAMPTNILVDKGGRIITVLPGCARDGRNAQTLSAEIAKLFKTNTAQIVEAGPTPRK
jgi:peroxiredoxin